MIHTQMGNIDKTIIDKIVSSIQEAVGDGIKEDMNGLKTQNSRASRIWDLLNTKLQSVFSTTYCMSYIFNRGPWQMIMLHEKENGFLFTIMREQRFKELSSKMSSRPNMHYVDMLAKHFNFDLKPKVEQISFFPHTFNDEDLLEEKVNSLLKNLKEDDATITRHVLILFESKHYELASIRAVMVNGNLSISSEQIWTKYIDAQESTIIPKIIAENSISDKPTGNLELKAKALVRKESAPLRQLENEEKNNA